mmetsp:Transcript_29182/g.70429  ORF Transcript_29182/g.70429 Transcript_29182/m.70429 type:complete len:689 (-) Transcript_29182:17-2083(-)
MESDEDQDDDTSSASSSSSSMNNDNDDDDEFSFDFDDFDLGRPEKPFRKWGSEAFVSVSIKQRTTSAAIQKNSNNNDKAEATSHGAEQLGAANSSLAEEETKLSNNDHDSSEKNPTDTEFLPVQSNAEEEESESLSESSSSDDDDDEADAGFFIYRGQYEYEARLDPHIVTKIRVDKSVSLTEIPNRAFQYCSLLTRCTLPRRGLTTIGIGAFEDCSLLQEIDIPSTVIEIKTNAFWSCQSLRKLKLPEGLQIVGVGAFAYCEFETVVYPSTLLEIRDGAFHWNSGLTTVYLKEGLKKIGKDAFSHCESLVNVNIPRTVNEISKGCFDGCGQLMSVEVSPSLVNIGNYAFHLCEKLRLIYHENYLGNGAFFSCTDLQVNLITDEDQEEDDDDDAETQANLWISNMVGKRFENLPLHRLCYKQACESPKNQVTHQERIGQILQQDYSSSDDYGTNHHSYPIDLLVDAYGMTAFHVLALSVRPNIGLFQQLQQVYPKATLTMQDHWKTMPLEYLLCNKAPGTVEMVQSMMEWGFQSRIQFLGLVQWKQEVQFELDGFVADLVATTTTRTTTTSSSELQQREQLHQFLLKLLHYERLEALSLLECALWKSKLEQQQAATIRMMETLGTTSSNNVVSSLQQVNNDAAGGGEDRSLCRFWCGADVVIVNVLSFLGPVMLPNTKSESLRYHNNS